MDYRKDGYDIREDQGNQLLINWAGISAVLPLIPNKSSLIFDDELLRWKMNNMNLHHWIQMASPSLLLSITKFHREIKTILVPNVITPSRLSCLLKKVKVKDSWQHIIEFIALGTRILSVQLIYHKIGIIATFTVIATAVLS